MANTFGRSFTVETFKNSLGVEHLPFYTKKDKFYVDPTTSEVTDVPVLLNWTPISEESVKDCPFPVVRTKDNTPMVICRMAYEVAKDVATLGHPDDSRPLQVIEVQVDNSGTLMSLCYGAKPAFMA